MPGTAMVNAVADDNDRADLIEYFGSGGRIYPLNKRDGVIRLLVPDGKKRA